MSDPAELSGSVCSRDAPAARIDERDIFCLTLCILDKGKDRYLHSAMSLPLTKPGTVREQHTTHIPLFRVLLHNDDVNTMEHVVRTLIRVFKFDKVLSERIMMEAHQKGLALCTVEPYEQAELHRDQLLSFSLTATIEQE